MGKIRPVLVLQSDMLNDQQHPSTVIAPLTTNLLDLKKSYPLRFRVTKRDSLDTDSDIALDQLKALDNRRFVKHLANLNLKEQLLIDEQVKIILDMHS